jgi:hypothetical protein
VALYPEIERVLLPLVLPERFLSYRVEIQGYPFNTGQLKYGHRYSKCPEDPPLAVSLLRSLKPVYCRESRLIWIPAGWKAWAADHAKTFQRASSAVEGRNGYLSQMHHNHRGLPSFRTFLRRCYAKSMHCPCLVSAAQLWR